MQWIPDSTNPDKVGSAILSRFITDNNSLHSATVILPSGDTVNYREEWAGHCFTVLIRKGNKLLPIHWTSAIFVLSMFQRLHLHCSLQWRLWSQHEGVLSRSPAYRGENLFGKRKSGGEFDATIWAYCTLSVLFTTAQSSTVQYVFCSYPDESLIMKPISLICTGRGCDQCQGGVGLQRGWWTAEKPLDAAASADRDALLNRGRLQQ